MFLQTHLTFGKEFTEAVEMKQVAQQEAERARFVVEKVFLLSPKPPASYICTPDECVCVSVGLRDQEKSRIQLFFFHLLGRATEAGSHHLSRRGFPGCSAHRQLTDGGW